jgi:hypothetical protein
MSGRSIVLSVWRSGGDLFPRGRLWKTFSGDIVANLWNKDAVIFDYVVVWLTLAD